MASVSGEIDWQFSSYRLGPGFHTLCWTYAKDQTVSVGADAGWLDEAIYQPDPPVVSVVPALIRARVGTTAIFQSQVVGAKPLSYQWYKDTAPKLGATNTVLVFTNLMPDDAGRYSLQVANLGGTCLSAAVTLVVVGKARFFDLGLTDTGEFSVSAVDETGLGYVPDDVLGLSVQVSTNVVNWEPLPVQLTLTNGILKFNDMLSTNYTVRFYRLVQQQPGFERRCG